MIIFLSDLAGACCIKYVCGRVQCCLAGILDNTYDETNTNYLHGNIIGDSKRLQAMGIRSREPPATPEAPAALAAAKMQRIRAVGKSTLIPSVRAAARAMMEMVIAAPPC